MSDSNNVTMLVEELAGLPGIGRKTATRLAYYLLGLPEERVRDIASTLVNTRSNTTFCSVCYDITDHSPCNICASSSRDRSMIFVVEHPRDVHAIERIHEYKGLYHVLHGNISPMAGRGPSDIRLRELLTRLSDKTVTELILATNPDVEGEATAMYISRLLEPMDLLVTRIAHGIPVGSDLELADEVTLHRAISGRRALG